MVEKIRKNLIPIAIVAAGIIIAGALFWINRTGKEIGEILTAGQAGEKVINYINQNLMAEGLTATLVKVDEENGVYKVRFKAADREYDSYVTKNGKLLFLQSFDLEQTLPVAQEPEIQKEQTIGNFLVSQDEICQENGKPIVYFFGSKRCPHCLWEHPIIETVVGNFEGYISFHNNMDSGEDMEIFQKYSTGGIPTLVLGCKYYRVGSGERLGQEEEAKVLKALICKLTENQLVEVCAKVQDLIDQI